MKILLGGLTLFFALGMIAEKDKDKSKYITCGFVLSMLGLLIC